MSETDAEFLDRIESVDPFNPSWRPGDSVRLDMPDFARLFALARRGAAMQWRPIETAPRDEAEFIAYRPDAGVFTAGYDDEQDVWFASHGYEDITDDLPTHWMPLPPPPKGAEE